MEHAPDLSRHELNPLALASLEGQRGVVLNLPEIETALLAVAGAFEDINSGLKSPRDRFDDVSVERMMSGYAAVDAFIAQRIDLFSVGQLKWFLELNALVLCGRDLEVRSNAAHHLAATEKHFYDTAEGGIRDVIEWHAIHADESPWVRAAGVYIRVMSEPQLFIEGNHRTGTLLMSYILARDGLPPFVLTRESVASFLDRSSQFTAKCKTGMRLSLEMPWLKRRFAAFLREESNPKFLRAV
jgi:hypothetical protein